MAEHPGAVSAAGRLDADEVAKFDQASLSWWDPQGPMRTLHAINPVRAEYIRARCALRGARILDIGCGGGLLAEELARAGAQVTAIDPAEAALVQARAHAQDAGLAIDYRRQNSGALAQREPGAYDAVVCMELLEHVPDADALVGDCAHLVRPGGAVFLSTLNRTPAAFLQAIVAAEHLLRLLPAGTHRYDRFIRPSELSGSLRGHGLEVLDIRGLAYRPAFGDARLRARPDVNYLVHARRPGDAAKASHPAGQKP